MLFVLEQQITKSSIVKECRIEFEAEESCIFVSDVLLSKTCPKGHGIWLFLVMKFRGIWVCTMWNIMIAGFNGLWAPPGCFCHVVH